MWIDRDELKMLVVWVVVVGTFAVGIWWPARQQRQALDQRISGYEQALARAKESPSLDAWHKTVASLEREVTASRQRLPAQGEPVNVLRGLSEVLDRRGVTKRQVSTEAARHFGRFGVTPIVVKFRGRFPDAHAVVKRIEQMPRLIQVDRFAVTGSPEGGTDPRRVHLELSAFFRRQEPPAP
jgi:Tfp pilus assembly protein PilO